MISMNEPDLSDEALAELLTLTMDVNEYGTIRYQNHLAQLHRVHGPAVIREGARHWYQNGKCHRDDGPAMVWHSGNKIWYQNGLLHRADGPAIEWIGMDNEWWLYGVKHTEEEFNERIRSL